MSKRTLDSFFSPPTKKPRPSNESQKVSSTPSLEATKTSLVTPSTITRSVSPPPKPETSTSATTAFSYHTTYPWPIPHLPPTLTTPLSDLVTAQGKAMTNQPDLDLLYFQPFIPRPTATAPFNFLRSELPFYRVQYKIKRFGTETTINTPRYTTVFGVDETSRFRMNSTSDTTPILVDTSTTKTISPSKYRCSPRPIPTCLDTLLHITEAATGSTYNICLVNYYATGTDSISFHSDDEVFLGPNPAIASFTLGDSQRDFVMKHKPPNSGPHPPPGLAAPAAPVLAAEQIKLRLCAGDMVLMRGPTQANWLHSVPKRKGAEAERGRINITLRRAMVPAGTENYYRYNVGEGGVYRWNQGRRVMVPWEGGGTG